MNYIVEETFGIAQIRGLERDDFLAKAHDILKDGEILETTLNVVVPADYEPGGMNSGMQGTRDSDIDKIRAEAGNACSRWCKAKWKQ